MTKEKGPESHSFDATLRTSVGAVVAFGAAFSGLALLLYGARAALSVAVGATIAALNLYVLAIVGRGMTGGPGATLAPLIGLVKVLALFGGTWVLLAQKLVDPLPLVGGLLALPLGIAAAAVIPARRE